MSEFRRKAVDCLVAVCATLVLTDRDENFLMWLEILREVLPDCEDCPDPVIPLRVAAEALVEVKAGVDRTSAMLRLRIEVRNYYRVAAAYRHEAYRVAIGAQVVE